MVMAYRFSEELGLCAQGAVSRIEAHLKQAGLPTRISDIACKDMPDRETLLRHIAQDKKVRRGRITLVLAHALGEAFLTQDIAEEKLAAFIGNQIDEGVKG